MRIVRTTVPDPARVKAIIAKLDSGYKVAEALGRHWTTVYRWSRYGRIPMEYCPALIEMGKRAVPFPLTPDEIAFLRNDPEFREANKALTGGVVHCPCCRFPVPPGADGTVAGPRATPVAAETSGDDLSALLGE